LLTPVPFPVPRIDSEDQDQLTLIAPLGRGRTLLAFFKKVSNFQYGKDELTFALHYDKREELLKGRQNA
jgi:hypothetical protein